MTKILLDVINNARQNGQHIILRQRPTIIYDMDGNILSDGQHHGSHAITVTGITEGGDIIISTWGAEAIVRPSDYLRNGSFLTFEIATFH